MTRLTIRVDFPGGLSIGPGKIALLEAIAAAGSIRKAAAALRMSYRRAWVLLDALQHSFGGPLVETATGGRRGGGASLTPLGRFVVEHYRHLEAAASRAAARDTALLAAEIGPERGGATESRVAGGRRRTVSKPLKHK
jgi:molybdate transport system regulatory protein